MSTTTLATTADALIAVVLIAAVTVLLALHDLSEATAIALFSTAVTLIGGTTKAIIALKVPTPSETQG
jgi:hypothetical protein